MVTSTLKERKMKADEKLILLVLNLILKFKKSKKVKK